VTARLRELLGEDAGVDDLIDADAPAEEGLDEE
jgi:hypothetical protein